MNQFIVINCSQNLVLYDIKKIVILGIGLLCCIYTPALAQLENVKSDLLLGHIQRVTQQHDHFAASVAEVLQEGIDVSYEQRTLIVSELFLRVIRADIQQGLYDLAERELQQLERTLQKAQGELQAVRHRPTSRLSAREVNSSRVILENGYFRDEQHQPVFLSGLNKFNNGNDDLAQAGRKLGFNLARLHIGPKTLMTRPGRIDPTKIEELVRKLQQLHALGYRVIVFLGHHMPQWAHEQYPGLSNGQGHFIFHNIDDPASLMVWEKVIDEVLPKIAGHPAILGYSLANEPYWDSISPQGIEYFRLEMKKKYKTIENLNTLWNTAYADFDQIVDAYEFDDVGSAQWYEWCRFNQQRVTAWFVALHDMIRRHDPDARCLIKISNEPTFRGTRTGFKHRKVPPSQQWGIDREALIDRMEMNGCDTRPIQEVTSTIRANSDESEEYAIAWQGQAITFDLQRSIAPEKPILDTEWHAVQTGKFINPNLPAQHIETALWLAHLYGMAGNRTWWWSRDGFEPLKGSDQRFFEGSLATQPQVLNAFVRTMLQLNTVAASLTGLASEPTEVRLFYSNVSCIHSITHIDAQLATHEALTFINRPLGFVTPKMLGTDMPTDMKLLVLAGVTHATDQTVTRLRSYVAQGGQLLIVGEDALALDEYGKQRSRGDLAFLTQVPKLAEQSPRKLRKSIAPFVDNLCTRPFAQCLKPLDKGDVTRSQLPVWGVICRSAVIEGKKVMCLINVNKHAVDVSLAWDKCLIQKYENLLANDKKVERNSIHLEPLEVRLLEVD